MPVESGQRPSARQRRIGRRLEDMERILEELEISIEDHTGQRFDPGSSLDVAYSDKRPGLQHAQVVETVRPSVYFKGRLVAPGKVGIELPE